MERYYFLVLLLVLFLFSPVVNLGPGLKSRSNGSRLRGHLKLKTKQQNNQDLLCDLGY